jgi:thiosulfate dehydrogenase
MNRKSIILIFILAFILFSLLISKRTGEKKSIDKFHPAKDSNLIWIPPDINNIPNTEDGSLILYGRALIINTAYYFGPKGTVANAGNGMNCQNCHLEAGTKMFGNNFSKVANGYPRFKDRSGSIESIEKKVEDCFERSMNGYIIDSTGKEMKAIVAYLKWVGSKTKKNTSPPGSGIEDLPFMNRAADPSKGRMVFLRRCQSCHGKDGEGKLKENGFGFLYPPLWGKFTFNTGASLYRISKLAGFVKNNMPYGTTYSRPILSNEESWDVAAYINANYHPVKETKGDYPDLARKPFDDPFGPYAEDKFSEKDHKFGPFILIKKFYDSLKKK